MLVPSYVRHTRKTISHCLHTQMYENILEKAKADLQDVTVPSLTIDGWMSINNQNYIVLTVHFLNLNTKLCSHFIGCISYNEKCSLPNF